MHISGLAALGVEVDKIAGAANFGQACGQVTKLEGGFIESGDLNNPCSGGFDGNSYLPSYGFGYS